MIDADRRALPVNRANLCRRLGALSRAAAPYLHMRRRCDTGMELGPFTWADLHHWQSFTGHVLHPFELQIFERLDGEMLKVRKKK